MTTAAAADVSGGRAAPTRALWIILALAVALRLAMTGDHDILALNQPFDDYWYVWTAHSDIWRMPYDQMAFAQLQLFAIWIDVVARFGVPLRLALDLAWIASALVAALAVARLSRRVGPAVLLFVFLAFHPYSIALFDHALAENLAASMASLAIGSSLLAWIHRSAGPEPSSGTSHFALAIWGVAFACAYHLRKEGVVLVVPLLALALLSLFDRRSWWSAGRRAFGVVFFGAPLVATLVLGTALAGANAARWGVFARYDLATGSYVRAVHTLNRIAPPAPTPRYVTVTKATRDMAYAVSPTFAEVRPWLDGPMVESVVAETERYFGVKGEIGNGWFYWTLRDAAATAGWFRSPHTADAKFTAMSDEIDAAFRDGRLKSRAAPIPFVDPEWRHWLPDVPGAFAREWRQAVAPVATDLAAPPEDATSAQKPTYVAATGRRRPFAQSSFEGWVIAPVNSRVAIGDGIHPPAWSTLAGVQRPDVPDAFPVHLEAPWPTSSARLLVEVPGHPSASIALADLADGRVFVPAGENAVRIGVDDVSRPPSRPWIEGALPTLCTVWSAFGWALIAIGAVALVRGLVRRDRSTFIVLAAAFVAIAARAGLFAILDSSSWSGTQARYLLPAVPFVALVGAIGCCNCFNRRWDLSRSAPK